MAWIKQGLIVEPRGQAAWVGTHAALPVVLNTATMGSACTSARVTLTNRSHIGYAALDLSQAARRRAYSRAAAVLSPGPLGRFDDAGVTTSCRGRHGRAGFISIYTGWALGVSVPFYLHAGLAVSDDGGRPLHPCLAGAAPGAL